VARYKLPREHAFPDYEPRAWEASNDFATAKVVSVSDYTPPREAKHQRIRADTRYCLEVEDTHNFMTADGLVQNCAIDCVVTARVMPKLAEAVSLRGQEDIVGYDHRIQSVCAGMHRVGMFVDRPLVAVKSDELKKTVMEHLAAVREHAERPDMNPNSTAQVRDLLFEKWQLTPTELTAMGDASTSDEAIRLLRTQNRDREQVVKFIDALRRFRKYSKEYGTYVRKLVPFDEPLDGFQFADDEDGGDVDEIDREASIEEQRRQTLLLPKKKRGLILFDKRIHPDYNAHGTTSGRLSSSRPNAQNFPKHLRALIMAQPGFVLVGADADQLELRIIASIAQIPRYLETLAKGGDPHADTASMMFGKAFDDLVPKSDQWSKLRGISKGIAYASFYGSGDETVHGLVTSAETPDGVLMYPDLTLAQVTALRRRWLKNIPQLQAWWDDCLETYRSQGYLVDPVWGRRRDFLDGEKFNEIINFGVQSGGAHIIHESTFPLVEAIPFERWGPGTGLINQCHDALVFEVPKEHEEHRPTDAEGKVKEKEREFGWCEIGCKCTANQVARMIKGAMNRSVPGLPDVTFAAKPKIGMRWSDV
jgi:DNA polymerase I-like protein with 3'-5' exonuclease and polymerase domains